MSRPTHPCQNPLCDRLTTATFCCGPCDRANERRYEIHEDGPLGHTESCNQRHAERSGRDNTEEPVPWTAEQLASARSEGKALAQWFTEQANTESPVP